MQLVVLSAIFRSASGHLGKQQTSISSGQAESGSLQVWLSPPGYCLPPGHRSWRSPPLSKLTHISPHLRPALPPDSANRKKVQKRRRRESWGSVGEEEEEGEAWERLSSREPPGVGRSGRGIGRRRRWVLTRVTGCGRGQAVPPHNT